MLVLLTQNQTLKRGLSPLAGVAQWIERWPEKQRVTSSIPSQDTCLGCGPGCPAGGAQHRETTYGCFCPSLSPSLPLPLKINKIFF